MFLHCSKSFFKWGISHIKPCKRTYTLSYQNKHMGWLLLSGHVWTLYVSAHSRINYCNIKMNNCNNIFVSNHFIYNTDFQIWTKLRQPSKNQSSCYLSLFVTLSSLLRQHCSSTLPKLWNLLGWVKIHVFPEGGRFILNYLTCSHIVMLSCLVQKVVAVSSFTACVLKSECIHKNHYRSL